jgi:8-oxo-dGTP pyrophosphatase MutT (NUDIX family)
MNLGLSLIERALALPDFDSFAAQQKMTPASRTNVRPKTQPGRARQGAVLLLLYCRREMWHVLLTRRPEEMNSHAGQISFPGGRREDGETLATTALRETEEEVGLPPAGVDLLGELATLYIPPSDFEVHPYVGYHPGPATFRRNPAEVAEILEVPLTHLLEPATRREEEWNLHGWRVTVPFFQVGPHKVWGATAMMLSEFLERLRLVGTQIHTD